MLTSESKNTDGSALLARFVKCRTMQKPDTTAGMLEKIMAKVCAKLPDIKPHVCNRTLPPSTGSVDRDGNWLDKWGACKVCDGEIPNGHHQHCDIYKMECQIRVMRAALEEVLTHRKDDKDGNYVLWIGEGTFLKCEAALNPPNDPGGFQPSVEEQL